MRPDARVGAAVEYFKSHDLSAARCRSVAVNLSHADSAFLMHAGILFSDERLGGRHRLVAGYLLHPQVIKPVATSKRNSDHSVVWEVFPCVAAMVYTFTFGGFFMHVSTSQAEEHGLQVLGRKTCCHDGGWVSSEVGRKADINNVWTHAAPAHSPVQSKCQSKLSVHGGFTLSLLPLMFPPSPSTPPSCW